MRNDYPDFIQQRLDAIRLRGGIEIVSDEEYTYILLALGEKPTGGYGIDVLQAELKVGPDGEFIQVTAKERRPAPEEFVIQVLTYPTAVYKIPKTNLPIKIKWERA